MAFHGNYFNQLTALNQLNQRRWRFNVFKINAKIGQFQYFFIGHNIEIWATNFSTFIVEILMNALEFFVN